MAAASFLSKVSEFFGLDLSDPADEYFEHDGADEDQGNYRSTVVQNLKPSPANQQDLSETVAPRISSINKVKRDSGTPEVSNNSYARVKKAEIQLESKNSRGISSRKKDNKNNIVSLPKKHLTLDRINKAETNRNNNDQVKEPILSRRSQQLFSKIAIKEPRVYSDALDIARLLLNNEAVLINFHLMDEHAAGRVIDFLTGAVFAVDGDIKRVGNEIFVITGSNMEIDGQVARSLFNDSRLDPDN
jgi:cell division inhibitor SepF